MTPDQERHAFYMHLGEAIACWAYVEAALLLVAESCVSEADRDTVGDGFYAIESFRSKLAFVDRIMGGKHAGSPILDRWKKLHDLVKSSSAVRNKLAHHAALAFTHGENPPGRRFGLVRWGVYRAQARAGQLAPKPPPEALCLADLATVIDRFGRVATGLSELAVQMRGIPLPELAASDPVRPDVSAISRRLAQVFAAQPDA